MCVHITNRSKTEHEIDLEGVEGSFPLHEFGIVSDGRK